MEILKLTLEPFNDIESVASLLGIPFDPNNHAAPNGNSADHTSSLSQAYASSASPAGALDPRSPEFKDILNRLAKAAIYLKTHHDIMDSERYEIWLEKLENRASSLVGRSMREIIEKASKQCLEIYEQKRYQAGNKFIVDDGPIESAPLYQKFRGLSYRLRELSALVLRGAFAEALALNHPNGHSKHANGKSGKKHKFALSSIKTHFPDQELEIPVINEVKQGYVVMRNELLLPFIKDAWLSSLTSSATANTAASLAPTPGSGIDLMKVLEEAKGAKTSNTAAEGPKTSVHVSLCTGIRQAFSTLLRVTQLELQLFESLFILPALDQSGNSTPATTPVVAHAQVESKTFFKVPSAGTGAGVVSPNSLYNQNSPGAAEATEVNSIVETIANTTRDFLRPFIIRESSVDELCRVVAALSEDVRSQMLGTFLVCFGCLFWVVIVHIWDELENVHVDDTPSFTVSYMF